MANPYPIAISRRSDGMIMEANHAFDEWFGIPAGSASGKLSLEFGLWTCQAERDEMLKILKEKGSVRNFQAIVARPSGEKRVMMPQYSTADHSR
jgi:PAS domain-containing protein